MTPSPPAGLPAGAQLGGRPERGGSYGTDRELFPVPGSGTAPPLLLRRPRPHASSRPRNYRTLKPRRGRSLERPPPKGPFATLLT